MRAIVLMGFMGTGKSEVGRRLARKLGRAFIDTDQLVEQRVGKSVAAIFADDGEAAFRAHEREAVAEAAERPASVIAVGGGAVLDAENVRRLREAGALVLLTADPDTILARVGDDAVRPLLAGGDRRARVAQLLDEREPIYEATADASIATTGRTVDEVVDEVRQLVERLERGERWKSSP